MLWLSALVTVVGLTPGTGLILSIRPLTSV